MKNLCGNVYKHFTDNTVTYSVIKFEELYIKILPIFNLYKIEDNKTLDYQYICLVGKLMKNKDHLTLDRLEKK